MVGPDPELERLRKVASDAHARYDRLSKLSTGVPDQVFVDVAKRLWDEAEMAVRDYEKGR